MPFVSYEELGVAFEKWKLIYPKDLPYGKRRKLFNRFINHPLPTSQLKGWQEWELTHEAERRMDVLYSANAHTLVRI